MAKLTRVTGKVFGSQASPTGDVDNGAYIGQFGSAQAGTYVGTDDVAMIQNLPAWEQGWIGACVEEDQLPPLPERTGVDKVLSYQECYLLQQGMPEWDSATTYYIDNFCSYNGVIYKSLTDINLNNQPDTSVANWEVYGKISQYTKFAINKGSVPLLINNSNELAFDVDNNNPLTYTNIMGETRTVTALSPIDVSAKNDGTYKVGLPQSGNQPYLFDGNVFIQETQPYKAYNIIGNPTISGGIASGFSSNNYLTLKNTFNPKTKNWKMTIPFTTGNDITTSNVIYSDGVAGVSQAISIGVRNGQLFIYLSSTGTSWDIANPVYAFNVSAETSYILELNFDVSDYNTKYSTDNGETWADGSGVTSSTPIYHAPIAYIGTSRGSAEFLGSIDVANMEFRVQDNLWINPQEMYTAQLDNISNWQDFNDVLLLDSSVTVESGVITALSQPKYNCNHIQPTFEHNPQIVETYVNGTSWYRVYSDGWCEQGGTAKPTLNAGAPVTYLKPLSSPAIFVSVAGDATGTTVSSWTNSAPAYSNSTNTGITIICDSIVGSTITVESKWEVAGYIA